MKQKRSFKYTLHNLKKSLLNHVRGKTEHPSILVIEDDIMKYLLDEEMTKEYGAKNIGEKSIINVCQVVN